MCLEKNNCPTARTPKNPTWAQGPFGNPSLLNNKQLRVLSKVTNRNVPEVIHNVAGVPPGAPRPFLLDATFGAGYASVMLSSLASRLATPRRARGVGRVPRPVSTPPPLFSRSCQRQPGKRCAASECRGRSPTHVSSAAAREQWAGASAATTNETIGVSMPSYFQEPGESRSCRTLLTLFLSLI